MSISGSERKTLLTLASRAIVERIRPGELLPGPDAEITDGLRNRCGAFVSLYVKGELRGCIGTFSEAQPLYKNVENMAVSAAVGDSRFKPIAARELPQLELEISVLSPRKRIFEPAEIILGKHGIYLKLDAYRGTLLPQVAVSQGWTVEEFLGNCAKYKAGIGWDGWKTAEIYTYEATVFRSPLPPI